MKTIHAMPRLRMQRVLQIALSDVFVVVGMLEVVMNEYLRMPRKSGFTKKVIALCKFLRFVLRVVFGNCQPLSGEVVIESSFIAEDVVEVVVDARQSVTRIQV